MGGVAICLFAPVHFLTTGLLNSLHMAVLETPLLFAQQYVGNRILDGMNLLKVTTTYLFGKPGH